MEQNKHIIQNNDFSLTNKLGYRNYKIFIEEYDELKCDIKKRALKSTLNPPQKEM